MSSAARTQAAQRGPERELRAVEGPGDPARFLRHDRRTEEEDDRAGSRRGKQEQTQREDDAARAHDRELAPGARGPVPAPAILESPPGLAMLEIAPALFKLSEHG